MLQLLVNLIAIVTGGVVTLYVQIKTVRRNERVRSELAAAERGAR